MKDFNIMSLVLISWLLVCSIQDIRKQEISLILLVAGCIPLFIISIIQGEIPLLERLTGLSLGVLLLILNKVTGDQIGLGDGLIFCITGISLGFYINSIILITSLFLSAIFSIFYVLIKKVSKKTTIPFVPFIFMASLGVYFSV